MKSALMMRVAVVGVLALAIMEVRHAAAQDAPAPPPAKAAAAQPAKEPATKPARTPRRANSRKPAAAKVPAVFTAALPELRREFQQGKFRSKPDYFTEKTSDEMTPEIVLSLLQGKHDRSPAVDAYIKWQLLSALPTPPAELPGQFIPDLMAAYLNAPLPELRPAMAPDQKKAWDKELKRAHDSDEVSLQLKKEVSRVADFNTSVFDYRDALMAKMPETFEGMEACLQDVFARAQAGADTQKAAAAALGRIQKWAADAPPKEVNNMLDLLNRLQSQKLPTFYQGIVPNPDGGRPHWGEQASGIGDIQRAITFMERNQNNATDGADNPIPKKSSRDSKRK